MKVSIPQEQVKLTMSFICFHHGGLFGKIPTDAYSSILKPIVDNGNIVVHGNGWCSKDDKLIERKLEDVNSNST